MKIAVNTRFLIKNKLEGLGLYAHEVLRRMVKDHPNDQFYFLFDRPFDTSFIYADNVQGVVIGPQARHPFLWWMWFELSVPRALKRIEADVFLSLDGYNSLRTNVRSVMVVHDLAFLHYGQFIPDLANKYYRYFTPKYLTKADKVICVSKATADDVVNQYNTDKIKIEIAYNGCRKEFYPRTQNEIQRIRQKYTDGIPYFLFVGAIHPRKNVIKMIQSFDQFKSTTGLPHKFVIVGRKAWHNSDMEEVFENAKFKADIIFTGYLQMEELADITSGAFALLYISLFEGFGVPMIEAMNCEVPIIASNCSSMPEVIGDAGLIVDPNNLDEIVEAMCNFVNDSELMKKIIGNGKTQRNKFDWKETANIIFNSLNSSR